MQQQLKAIPQDRKRKAEDVLTSLNGKGKKENTEMRPKNRSAVLESQDIVKAQKLTSPRYQDSANTGKPKLSTSASALSVPYRGTSQAEPKSASPTRSLGDTVKAAPKKGSYAEIMARAKASQTNTPFTGVIKHKPKDALSNKQKIILGKQALKAQRKLGSKGIRDRSMNNSDGSNSGSVTASKKFAGAGSASDKADPAGIKRAAKPQPSYKGTMRPVTAASVGHKSFNIKDSRNGREGGHGASNTRLPASKNRYDSGSVSEEEEDDDIDDESHPISDMSSDDMEAGFLDVEEEEVHATKYAKKEDEEQARLENQLKREKEERKRRLELMAKNAKKRAY